MFALLGAQVTVLDLSQEQLQRDREVARHYSLSIETVRGDMRDLSCFQEAAFDIVWHPYSINFIPDVQVIFRQVAHILRRDGLYNLTCTNPFASGMTEQDWNGAGIIVGLTAMAASDVPLVTLKVTNPKTWGVSGWLADLIPHLIYGFVTVATYEALAE